MTTTNQPDPTIIAEMSGRVRHTDQDGRERVWRSHRRRARVMAPQPARAHSHPDNPSSGFHPMSETRGVPAIAERCPRGYRLTEPIAPQSDRGANEIEQILRATPVCPGSSARVHGLSTLRLAPGWSADCSPGALT